MAANSINPYLLTYLLHGAESFLRSWPVFAASQEIPCIFMEPESSLPYSKCPPPVPIPSQLHPVPTTPSNFLKIHPTYVWVSTMVSFPEVYPPTPCASLSPPPYAPHAPPISFFSINHPQLLLLLLLTYLLHGAESFLRSWSVFAASQEIPCIFMEPESSLPYSQVPATRPYPEPTPSSPHDSLQLPEDPT